MSKMCSKCHESKPLTEFYFYKSGVNKGHAHSRCKQCTNKCSVEWARAHPERRHEIVGRPYMRESKYCALYLGVVVAEGVLSKIFKNIERMPMNNPGYDFVCGKGYKIDVKSSCLRTPNGKPPYWSFYIFKNKVADYFLCLAFDNREDLNPMRMWLIPGNAVNDRQQVCINARKPLYIWNQYEQPIDKIVQQCDKMKIEAHA